VSPPGSHSLSCFYYSDSDICYCYGAHSELASPDLGFEAFYHVSYCDFVSHCFDSGVEVGSGVSDNFR
jgi:hypothetical protein